MSLHVPREENDIELQSISLESNTTPGDSESTLANRTDSLDEDLVFDEIETHEVEDDSSKSSLKMAFMNMSNSILGAGIIGQPFATKNCGIFGSVIVFILLTLMVDWTIRLIIINCKLSGTKTYQQTAYKCFGKPGKILILVAQGFFAVGGSIAFCIIIGDTIPHVLQSIIPDSWTEKNYILKWLLERNTLIVILTCFISYPLSLTDNIANLAMSSFFALLNMLAIIIIIVVHGFTSESLSNFSFESKFQGYFINTSIFQGISVISFALVCHHNTSFIYDSLRRPTLDRFTKLTHWSCFISMICCSLVGISGDLMFKDSTKGNILNNFPQNDWIINIARVCFGLNMLTTFPLEIFVVRQVVYDLFIDNSNKHLDGLEAIPQEQRDDDADDDQKDEPENDDSTKQFHIHFVVTTILVFGTMVVSLLTCNLGATLEIIGSVSASIMAFIFPCMCYLKLTNYKAKTFGQNFPSYFIIVFGFLILIISTTQTVLQTLKEGNSGEHCKVG